KGGFLPFDGPAPKGLLGPGDLVAGTHCMSPHYLEDQLERSLDNLGLEQVDIYYVHNPETQLAELPRAAVLDRLKAAFEFLHGAHPAPRPGARDRARARARARRLRHDFGLHLSGTARAQPAARDRAISSRPLDRRATGAAVRALDARRGHCALRHEIDRSCGRSTGLGIRGAGALGAISEALRARLRRRSTGPIYFASSIQLSPRGRAAQLEMPRSRSPATLNVPSAQPSPQGFA